MGEAHTKGKPVYGIQDVMQGVLITPGPVATTKAVKRTKMVLKNISTREFSDAAKVLENANFGSFVKIPSRGSPRHVFIKKSPQEVHSALSANPALCDHRTYGSRYAKSCSKAITFELRSKLVAMKLVSPDHFM